MVDGKSTNSLNAIKTIIATNHSDDFQIIAKSMRDITGAINASQLERQKQCQEACLIAARIDSPLNSQVTGKRVSSAFSVSLFVIVNLLGRTLDRTVEYEERIDTLLNLCDSVTATLDAATTDDADNFYKIQIGALQDVPDPLEGYIAYEIPVDLWITRAS